VQKGFGRVFFFFSRRGELCNSGCAFGQADVFHGGLILDFYFCFFKQNLKIKKKKMIVTVL
jgi:hypothetical protein